MSRFVMAVLLAAAGVVLAGNRPAAEQDAGPAAPPQTRTDDARTETGDARSETGDTRTETENAQEPADATQAPADGGAQTAEAPAEPAEGSTVISVPGGSALGMSILGNQEAPTSLVIVPWKTSELGDSLGISPMLDDSRAPIDRDVFMRSLRYYAIVTGTTRQDGAAAGGR